jgi:hypothetical protein
MREVEDILLGGRKGKVKGCAACVKRSEREHDREIT